MTSDRSSVIYLDNSATTALSDAAKQKIASLLDVYGNPSSLHPLGQEARAVVESARREIALTLGIRALTDPGQVIFTACGSEADNLALLGVAHAKPRRRGGRIISTDSEHPAVENCLCALESEGYDVVRVPTRGGVLDFDFYASALNERTFLVSMMLVNNETGALYDLPRAFAMAKAKNPDVVTHCDAVQGYLKCRFSLASLQADLVTLSGHKIHAPKGVGALVVSKESLKRRDFVPVLLGGGQESGFRSGTENVLGIAAFGAAASDGFSRLSEDLSHLSSLRSYALDRLSSLPLRFHVPSGSVAPHILNFALPDIKSETMVHELSQSGICVSGGSACSSHSKSVSRSLLSFGISPAEAECSIRVSLSRYNTVSDIDSLASALSRAFEHLVKIHR